MSVNRTPLLVYRRIGNCVRGFLCTLISRTHTISLNFVHIFHPAPQNNLHTIKFQWINLESLNSIIIRRRIHKAKKTKTKYSTIDFVRLHLLFILSAQRTSTETNQLTNAKRNIYTSRCVRFLRSFHHYTSRVCVYICIVYIIYVCSVRCIFFLMKMIRFCFYGSVT